MSTRDRRQEIDRTARRIVQEKGAKPLTRKEINKLLRRDKAQQAAGFVEPDADDYYERFLRMLQQPPITTDDPHERYRQLIRRSQS